MFNVTKPSIACPSLSATRPVIFVCEKLFTQTDKIITTSRKYRIPTSPNWTFHIVCKGRENNHLLQTKFVIQKYIFSSYLQHFAFFYFSITQKNKRTMFFHKKMITLSHILTHKSENT